MNLTIHPGPDGIHAKLTYDGEEVVLKFGVEQLSWLFLTREQAETLRKELGKLLDVEEKVNPI